MPDSPIPLVVVGLNFGKRIVRDLTGNGGNAYVRLAGLCDLDREKAAAVSTQHGSLPVYDSLDDVLADSEVAAVGLFTGPRGRAALREKIIRAGKDAMTTKTFEDAAIAAASVLEEARNLGRIIHLNSPNPGISPDLDVIVGWKATMDLGPPVAARADVWAHYREEPDGRWYDDQEKCPAAPIFRLGIYQVNDLVRLFGPARCVNVLSTRLFTKRPTADNAQLGIEFENGALVNIFASFCVRDGDQYRNSLTVNYERGTIYRSVGPHREGNGAELSVIMNDDVLKPRRIADSVLVQTRSGDYNWRGFAAAVRGEPDAPGYEIEHIVEPLRIVAAMAEAERTGTKVDVARVSDPCSGVPVSGRGRGAGEMNT